MGLYDNALIKPEKSFGDSDIFNNGGFNQALGFGNQAGFTNFLSQNSLTPEQFAGFSLQEQSGIFDSFNANNGAAGSGLFSTGQDGLFSGQNLGSTISGIAGLASGIGGLYLGNQQLGLMKDQVGLQKQAYYDNKGRRDNFEGSTRAAFQGV